MSFCCEPFNLPRYEVEILGLFPKRGTHIGILGPSELCHALKRTAGSLFCTLTPPASKGGHKALRIALHAARRQTQQSTRARHHAVGATNPAANQPFGPPQREHSAAPRTHHAASDLSDPSQGSELATRSDWIVGCPLRNNVPTLSPHQLSCIALHHAMLRCLC